MIFWQNDFGQLEFLGRDGSPSRPLARTVTARRSSPTSHILLSTSHNPPEVR